MVRAIRVAMVWLLAFALPMQGAMAGMLACAARHAGPPAAVAQTLHHAAHAASAAHHHEAGHAGHAHPGAVSNADAGEGAHTAGVSATDTATNPHAANDIATGGTAEADTVSAGSCSLCASCCTAAALPSTMQPLGTPPVAHAHARPAAFAVGGIVPSGLERPPRILFA